MLKLKLKPNKLFLKEKLLSRGQISDGINFLSKKKNFKISVLGVLTFSLFLIIGFLSYSVYSIFNFADTQKNSMYSLNQSSAVYYNYNNGNNLYGGGFPPHIFGSFQYSGFFTFFVIAAVLSFIIVSLMFLYFYKLIIKQDNLELSLSSIEKNALEVPSLIFHEIKNNINALSINSKLLNSKLNNFNFHSGKNIINNNADNFNNTSEIKSDFVKIGSMIESETDKINLTMENIIKFSKSFKPDFEDICLDSLIRESINDIDLSYFNNNNINIKLNIDKQIIVRMDPSLMKQVFMNLVSNSINSYNGMPGSVYIYSSYYFSKAMIVIEDKGMGISKNNLKKIFEPFFTTRENGIGLGLAFVKKVIDSHGFSIDIDTQQSKGTKVSIILSHVLN
ncbi:MAG: HAMP domain-containing histidine kinase [Candidatus Acididesulfobacter diazotrophicus]|uniref:histidine kinase n=1 Tax=Candidatus Acididesulfobacter diazotrophicus TaxID=2597226 RepID=A0A519BNR2_9DELT|nr:MAG: HAMP domain-containing histidine kinase [Candidatus Acididesulfobacter diazotrophicus]